MTIIGSNAFYGCSGLTSVSIPNNVTSIGGSAFSGCTGLTSVSLPNSVTSIGESAFYGCVGLFSVSLPSSVVNVPSKAFADCSSLKDVFCHIEEVPSTAADAFANLTLSQMILHVPEKAVDEYRMIAPWSQFGKITALTEEETTIETLITDDGAMAGIFTIEGKPVNSLQLGVNIIKYKNGTVKKVMVK